MKHTLLILSCALLAACVGPSAKELKAAQIRYDLGVEAMRENKSLEAIAELQKAVELNPDLAEAHNALGLLYHLSARRLDRAEAAYKRALALKENFSEAQNNLGALYLEMGRYAEAERLFQKVLQDVLYPTPHLAQGNLGWAQYRLGRLDEAIESLSAAVVLQPRFCLGHRNLGDIYLEQGRVEDARVSYDAYLRHCPESGEAYHRSGRLALVTGDKEGALAAFATCMEKSVESKVGRECAKQVERLQAQGFGLPDAAAQP